MQIAVIAKKGGVGKSTIAVLLQQAYTLADRAAAVMDWDGQGTSNRALDLIGGERAKTTETYDFLIFDTPPNLEHTATLYAMRQADVVLVPTTPRIADRWEAVESAERAQTENSGAVVRLVVNQMRPRTRFGRLLAEGLEGSTVPVLNAMLSQREAYAQFLAVGWAALERPVRDEVIALATEVAQLN